MLQAFTLAAMFTLVFYLGYWIGHETEPRIPEKLRREVEILVSLYDNGNRINKTGYWRNNETLITHRFTRQEVVSMLAIALQQIKEIE